MIKIIKGDIFETPADIRINTVNCVGVMGAGVALAFKNKYPEMFRDYQKDCKAGKVKPGQIHVWKNLIGDWIINFPTKRHWREPSRYDDIEAGLIALRDYLIEQTKKHTNLRVALPALGCGHGGLDWKRVSQMIREHLSDLEAKIFVFEPSASRLAGQKIENGEDEESLEKLQSMGVVVIDPGHEKYPEALRGKSAAIFYAKGNLNILDSAFLAVLPSGKPSEREVNAATGCIEAIAQPGVTFLVGYGPAIERPSIRIALQKGADVALFLPDGIINFRVRQDLQDIWDEDRIIVLTAAKPNQKWNPSLAFRARDLQLTLAKAVLITDPAPDWLSRLLKKRNPSQTPSIFYVNYSTDDFPTKSIFGNFRAFPIGRSVDSGKPNVAPIIECLDILRAPVSIETDLSVTETYAHEAQIPEISGQVHEAPAEQAFSEKQSQLDGTPRYPKRLIEVDLPIKRISAHSRREKSIRHGHISTLHIWWARRPLAACRAVICASLWPDPADELCPNEFRKTARELMTKWAKDHLKLMSEESSRRFIAISKDDSKLDDNVELRKALLDFIADFANWDNSTVPEYLKTSRLLTQAAHEALGGEPGSRPLVVDPFAGGGSIPLEALRVGADAFASDLNPIPILLNHILTRFIPKYREKLAEDFVNLAQKIQHGAEKRLSEYYPPSQAGLPPVAYIWGRQVYCEGPGCGVQIPIIRSLCLAKRGSSSIGLELSYDEKSHSVAVRIVSGQSRFGPGTVKRGSVTCPACGYTIPVVRVREQLRSNGGGSDSSRLLAVVCRTNDGKTYHSPTDTDFLSIEKTRKVINRADVLPPIELPLMSGVFNVPIYGITRWDLLFSSRQLLTVKVFGEEIETICTNQTVIHRDRNRSLALKVLLLLTLGKYLDFRTTLCGWISTGEKIGHTFGRQALGMIFDWTEGTPFGDMSGSWKRCYEAVDRLIRLEASALDHEAIVEYADACEHPLPDDSSAAVITDPPYYNAVPYADLSDFFYVWLQPHLRNDFPSLFQESITPKDRELCEMKGWDPIRYPHKDANFYESGMLKALTEARRVCRPEGIAVVVFAHKTTTGWETLLSALVDAGWVVTGSWPIDTERAGRLRAMKSAALGSSVHLVCRPRENSDGSLRTDYIGDWRDVLTELPKRIHDWMPRLADEGVVGADAIFACIGPALEIYSRYSSVEKASGEKVELKEYLEQVWAAVSREALKMIFEGVDALGFEEDARLTAMWLWTLRTAAENGVKDGNEGKTKSIAGYDLEYDAARKIAQGLGAHLENLGHLVNIKGDTATLLSAGARTRYLFGKDAGESPKGRKRKKSKQQKFDFMGELKKMEDDSGDWAGDLSGRAGSTVLDQLHQSMILFGAGRGEALKRFLVDDGIGMNPLYWRLAQALSALYPSGTDEKRWVDGVLARKKGLGRQQGRS